MQTRVSFICEMKWKHQISCDSRWDKPCTLLISLNSIKNVACEQNWEIATNNGWKGKRKGMYLAICLVFFLKEKLDTSKKY